MGRLTQGHEFKKTGTTGGTLEATVYIICTNPFEIDPQKGNRGGKKSSLLLSETKSGIG